MQFSATKPILILALGFLTILIFGCGKMALGQKAPAPSAHGLFLTKAFPVKPVHKTELASFALGCFWGAEDLFRKQKGTVATAVGYMGGHTKKPTYAQVCAGDTGHAETVQVEFDPQIVGYADLLQLFWDAHDPTTPNQQGPDVGEQYRSVIFYHTEVQRQQADISKKNLQASGELSSPIVTEIIPAAAFTKAEDYHQQYVEKGGRASCNFRTKKKL